MGLLGVRWAFSTTIVLQSIMVLFVFMVLFVLADRHITGYPHQADKDTATLPIRRVCGSVFLCETYIGKPFGTRVVPQFTTEVAKPLTQSIEPYSNPSLSVLTGVWRSGGAA
jgi:hypothetical protein